jgi:hypothetical protein
MPAERHSLPDRSKRKGLIAANGLYAPLAELEAREAEVDRLRSAFAEYRLWEPGRRGYAAARRRLEEAFGYTNFEELARNGGLADE